MFSSLNLSKYANQSSILSSLAWNAVRASLNAIGHPEYVEFITSVKVTDTRITIKTGKPIINQELSLYREDILKRIEESFKTFGAAKVERKIVFL